MFEMYHVTCVFLYELPLDVKQFEEHPCKIGKSLNLICTEMIYFILYNDIQIILN